MSSRSHTATTENTVHRPGDEGQRTTHQTSAAHSRIEHQTNTTGLPGTHENMCEQRGRMTIAHLQRERGAAESIVRARLRSDQSRRRKTNPANKIAVSFRQA